MGRSAGTEGGFGASEKNSATGLQQLECRETCTDGQCHRSALPSLRHVATSVDAGWVWKLGLQRSDQGEDCGGLRGNTLRGWSLVRPQLGVYTEEAWAALEAKRHCVGGVCGQGQDLLFQPFSLCELSGSRALPTRDPGAVVSCLCSHGVLQGCA